MHNNPYKVSQFHERAYDTISETFPIIGTSLLAPKGPKKNIRSTKYVKSLHVQD